MDDTVKESAMHDLAAPYALDALDDDERVRFESHLETCPECRRLVADLRSTVASLAAGTEVEPPARLRATVMAAIDAETAGSGEDLAPVISLESRRRRMTIAVSAAVGIAAVALAAVLTTGMLSSGDPVDEILADADSTEIVVDSDVVVGGRVVFSPERNQAVFTAAELPSVAGDETYELWLIDDSGAVPAGLFTPEEDGSAEVLVDGEVTPGLTLGLTVEPAGGSTIPTGDVIVAQLIG
jgi:anti-sigma-K factor RskA